MKKWMVAIVALIGCVGFCLFAKSTYTDAVDYQNPIESMGHSYVELNSWSGSEEILAAEEQEASIVARVRVKKITGIHWGNLCHVEVLEVYRGDQSLTGKTVHIFSRAYLHADILDWVFYTPGILNVMKQGEEYLVFMNPAPLKEGYDPSYLLPDDMKQPQNLYFTVDYNGLQSGGFWLNVREVENVIPEERLEEANDWTYYRNVADNEIIVGSQGDIEAFLEFKHQILNKYLGE